MCIKIPPGYLRKIKLTTYYNSSGLYNNKIQMPHNEPKSPM